MEQFPALLAKKTTLLGFKDTKNELKVDPESLDELNEVTTHLFDNE